MDTRHPRTQGTQGQIQRSMQIYTHSYEEKQGEGRKHNHADKETNDKHRQINRKGQMHRDTN